MSGRLSYQRTGCKQLPQRDPGQRRLFSNGSRATATLTKLPMAMPSTNTSVNQ